MGVTCEKCSGRGWVGPAKKRCDEWALTCPICNGATVISPRRLAKLTGESSSTIRRFLAGKKMLARTCLRLIDKLQGLA